MITLELDKRDWRSLHAFIAAASSARSSILRAVEKGKQQVTVQDDAIKNFLAQDVPPEVWLKLGGLLADKLKGESDE